METKTIIKIATWVGIGILFLIIWPFANIPAGSEGVMTTFGAASNEIYAPGIHFRIPLVQNLNKVPVSIQASQDTGHAASKDLQTVETTITLNYHISPDKVVSIFSDLGNNPEDRIIRPSVQEAVKSVTARYTAEELISKRDEVRNGIITELTDRLKRHGLMVDEMSITNFKFSQAFDAAIEAKMVAAQTKLKAEQELQTARVTAEQTVVAAKAQADALAAQKQQITPDLLALRHMENEAAAIEKWDGTMPQYVTSGQALPFIGMGATSK